MVADGWHIVNNPMAWGSAQPRVLVLGVSKGTTQCDAIATKPHNAVPFDGFRPALTRALQLLGLLQPSETVDNKIKEDEKDWAFGSMVRCALGIPKESYGIERSGTVVQRLARMPIENSWITRCSSRFLSRLPATVQIVVLLSNDDAYIESCFAAVKRLRPSTRRINSVAYGDGQVSWVHIIHVGGPGKNHINAWFHGEGTQGEKRYAAQRAVCAAQGLADAEASLVVSSSPPPRSIPKGDDRIASSNVAATGRGENVTRDAMLASIKRHGSFRSHPSQSSEEGTKYISGFLCKNGRAIAVDKTAANKQPIWMQDEPSARHLLERLGIQYDYYAADRGRNSNLKKFVEFKEQALLRAFPNTVEEGLAIADGVSHF